MRFKNKIVNQLQFRAVLVCSILLFATFVFAQDEKDKWSEGEIQKVEIEIVKDRQISVPQASRNFEKIPPRAVEPIKPEITYQFKNLAFNVSDYNPAIRPLRLKTESISKIYGNYISAGLGNYGSPLSPYAEAYATSKRNKNKYYGVKFFHRIFFNGPVDNGNSGSGNTEMRLFGKTMSDKIAIGGFANFENSSTNPFFPVAAFGLCCM